MLPIIDTEGQVALVDYTIGDTVGVPTAFAASGSERIAAITLTESEDGSYEVTLVWWRHVGPGTLRRRRRQAWLGRRRKW